MNPISRRLLLAASTALAACTAETTARGPAVMPAKLQTDSFLLRDGAALPYRAWRPETPATAVVLALHGFNDSRDAWELPAPAFAAAGIAIYAPDQRGFGAAPGRGLWPGGDTMADDAADMVAVLRATHPGKRLFLMGESMGGAVLMRLATRPTPPDVDGYILLAPAVWGRAKMNPVMQASLWLASTLVPGMEVPNRPPPGVRVIPTDNVEALKRLSSNPLTLRSTRFDTLRGLVDLMDDALAAAPDFRAPALFLYGARDDLVPPPATRAIWRSMPAGPRRVLYPEGYHLVMRDHARAAPIGDAIAWITNPTADLPSGGEARAVAWLANNA
jgi:alpha-beta hydrolase superfamily lysophospholipase